MTLSLALGAGAAGCSMAHNPEVDGGDDPVDAALADAGVDGGDIDCSGPDWWDSEVCCERSGGFWSPPGGCAVPGPFVPPNLPA